MFGMLPVLFAGDGIAASIGLRELAIMVVVALPLVLGRPVFRLTGLRRPLGLPGSRMRTVAGIIVGLGYHLGHFKNPRARQHFSPVALADGVWA